MANEEPEIWKPVCGYEGLYEVSSMGRVRSLPRTKNHWRGGASVVAGGILKPDGASGYLRVSLHRGGKLNRQSIHRLVARAFIGDDPRRHVNHMNGIKSDNRLENLEWATPRENVRHAWKTGLSSPIRGENHGRSKISDEDVRKICRSAAAGISQRSLATVFCISESMVSQIVLGKSWSHIHPESTVA